MVDISTNNSVNNEDLLDRLNRHLDWIKSCDTKTSIVLAITGIFFTIFASSPSLNTLKDIFAGIFTNINFANLLYLIFFLISCFICIYGVYCLIKVLIPRLEKDILNDDDLYGDSLYYFESISKNKFIDFKNKMLNESDITRRDDLISQIYINAYISNIKYQFYRKGITNTFLGITLILVLYIFGLILLTVGGI